VVFHYRSILQCLHSRVQCSTVLVSLLSILGMHIVRVWAACVASKVSTVTLTSVDCLALDGENQHLRGWQGSAGPPMPSKW